MMRTRGIDGGRGASRVRGEAGVGGIISPNKARGVLDRDVTTVIMHQRHSSCDITKEISHGEIIGGGFGGGLASDQTTPRFVALVDNLHSVLLVFSLAREGEGVLGLSIGDFVNPIKSVNQIKSPKKGRSKKDF